MRGEHGEEKKKSDETNSSPLRAVRVAVRGERERERSVGTPSVRELWHTRTINYRCTPFMNTTSYTANKNRPTVLNMVISCIAPHTPSHDVALI